MSTRILAYTATTSAGPGLTQLRECIARRESGLRPNDLEHCALKTWIGRVVGIPEVSWPESFDPLDSRNNRLAWLGLQQDGFLEKVVSLRERFGPDRVGIAAATSTSSIARTEEAYRQLQENGEMAEAFRQQDIHDLHSPGHFLGVACGLTGPAMTISTACSSSAKVFVAGARWLEQGLVDAVLLAGVDSLCLNILYGFNSLQLLSQQPCRPFDAARNGISIGEAAGFALMVRDNSEEEGRARLLGYGESSDAWHMSHPHPEGRGAVLAMQQAVERAGVGFADIDYINLHGTATPANDRIETLALAECFPEALPASSTKGWTGHTLGAAGMVEAVIAMDAIATGVIPGTLNCDAPDPELAFPIQQENLEREVSVAMSNSFGFGGNNACLVFGACGD